MTPELLTAATALGLAALGCPLAARLARHWGLVDAPDAQRYHSRATPLLGGLAIYGAVWLALLATDQMPTGERGLTLFLAATLITAVGLLDDRRQLAVLPKLVAQVAAALLLIAGGWLVVLPVAVAPLVLLTALWSIGLTNAFNLLDNMDGVAAGAALAAAVGGLAVLLLADPGAANSVAVLAAVSGATAGFLLFNWPPARLFMGDAGSLFLGLVLATAGVEIEQRLSDPASAWLVPMVLFGLPLFDTTLVSLSRLRRGRNPLTTPGKDHLSHRLVARGWSERRTATSLTASGLVLGGLAAAMATAPASVRWAIAVVVALLALAALITLERTYRPASTSP